MSDTAQGPGTGSRCARILNLLGIIITLIGFVTGTFYLLKGAEHGHHAPHDELKMVTTLFGITGAGLLLLVIGLLLGLKGQRPKFSVARVLATLVILAIAGVVFGLGALRTFHFLESPGFCGKICHSVMKPESDTFEVSPHANITCAACHVGPGIPAFVKSKINGTKELVHLMTGNFERPHEVPLHNMRPASETCGECHGADKLHGPVLHERTFYRTDEENSPWTVAMVMDMPGGTDDPHWCVEGGKTIEFVSADNRRLVIPWVRVTDKQGNETVYRTSDKDEAIADEEVAGLHLRRFDCTDCHNRIGHNFLSPNEAVDAAITEGHLNRSIPSIKLNAASLIAEEYESTEAADKAIEEGIREEYGDREDVDQIIDEVKAVYAANFFPEMKVTWKHFPNHLGHAHNRGCFRCHDGKHMSEDGSTITHDCNTCHRIIAQGPGDEVSVGSMKGIGYKHPEDIDGEWKTERCDSCHDGGPM